MKQEQKALAHRYAQALFELSSSENQVELVGSELQQFVNLLEESSELNNVFTNPVFVQEQRKVVVQDVAQKGNFHKHTRNFLLLLLDKKRASLLPQIQKSYQELSDLQAKRLHVKVTTAAEPTPEFIEELKQKLSKQTNQEVVLHFEVDASLLGGTIVQMGDSMLDGSVLAQLTSMKEQLLHQV